jgi:hypothetical protein
MKVTLDAFLPTQGILQPYESAHGIGTEQNLLHLQGIQDIVDILAKGIEHPGAVQFTDPGATMSTKIRHDEAKGIEVRSNQRKPVPTIQSETVEHKNRLTTTQNPNKNRTPVPHFDHWHGIVLSIFFGYISPS